MPANLENSTDHRKRSVFIPIPKKHNAKEYSNYHTIALPSHASNVTHKVLQARLQQYMKQELQMNKICLKRQRNQGSSCKNPSAHR